MVHTMLALVPQVQPKQKKMKNRFKYVFRKVDKIIQKAKEILPQNCSLSLSCIYGQQV